jgi:hypothetical protein
LGIESEAFEGRRTNGGAVLESSTTSTH